MKRVIIRSGEPFEDVYGYSRAVRAGDHVHVSGTTARDADLDGDAYHQAKAALLIIAAALHEAGASVTDVVRTVTYVTDIEDAILVATAHREIFAEVRPAATLVQVAALVGGDHVKIEIEAYAITSGPR
jgi:enamine deaminase RidA (YjgF/YER057c/UK114 family)